MPKNTKKQHLQREIGRLVGIVFASFFFAMGYSWFLLPYNMAPGGVGGISQILYHFLGIPNGVSMIILNIPLFIISFIFIGKSFGSKSLYGMFVSSIMTDLLSFPALHKMGIISDLKPYTHIVNGHKIYAMLAPEDILLSAIAGSVLLGLGLGLIFRFRGSTGGTDIPVALIKQKANLSIGTGYFIVETGIILLVAITFKAPKLLIWGYVNLFITTKITDLASEGLPYIKGAYIISDAVEEIRLQIFTKLERGVTYLNGVSGFHRRDIKILFVVLNRRQVPLLTDIVKDVDPDAFMIIMDVYDVLGYGFKSRSLNLSE
ncbi:MAG TPA: YitT family protein [Candidatus Cloacimonas acidaminovorans]|nr:YitT family protein [Candidatus Cloacimonas acidaminovorans]HQF35384.1 YitT family protein [Candidatus Cloacimonas acidaminovorans]HQI53117.1 YitT family protein [Candidatus Cloacimonas acidaminovorans]HQJ17218.1 YitT family protein [Candidatus Cloacimonas acidaminovorans]